MFNDELLPENFEKIAKAYSQSLKNRGTIFVCLHEHQCETLLSEILIIFAKMRACTDKLKNNVDSRSLLQQITQSENILQKKFGNKNPHSFVYVENENSSFLSLIGLENSLIAKLLLLAFESGELEMCISIITNITQIFSESLITECFLELTN